MQAYPGDGFNHPCADFQYSHYHRIKLRPCEFRFAKPLVYQRMHQLDGDVGMPATIAALQTFGDLINYHPHIHAVAPEGVFTESGYFVHIPYVCRLRAVEI
jgi:hypothetical protein